MNPEKISIEWRKIYLQDNPFQIKPPIEPQKVKWAGMMKLRDQLESVLREALTSERGQIVLNRGLIGTGKTHAARYFSLPEHMPKVSGKKVREPYSLYIETPKEPDQAVKQLYRQVVEQISITRLTESLKKISAELPKEDFIDKYRGLAGSEEFALALWKFGRSKDEEEISILKRYFLLTGATKTELKKLGVGRTIDSLLDQSGVLAAFLHSIIGIDPSAALEEHSRIFLWIDEMEDLVYYHARYYLPFSQILRNLTDRVPNFFTLFMNFTMTRPGREEEINTILGEYLIDRITDVIKFEELGEDEGLEYIRDLLAEYRTEDFIVEKLSPFYPFKENTLKEIISKLARRTPRDINKKCHELVEHAFKDNLFRTRGKDWIDPLT